MIGNGAASPAQLLRHCGLDPLDARVLLCHVLQWERPALITRADQTLDEDAVQRFTALVARRQAGEPIAQLVGEREFFGRPFIVTPAVLIPRPDTELLVELALQAIDRIGTPLRVLDLGTGSGAIALTLAAERPAADVLATDLSTAALAVAAANAQALLATAGSRPLRDVPPGRDRLRFAQGSWFEALGAALATDPPRASDIAPASFDLIVSNPPYIASGDPHLDQGDLRFEPRGALTDEADGLRDLRTIAHHAPHWLRAGGHLMVEHGYDQGQAVRALFASAGFTDVTTVRDLGDRDRVTTGVWPEPSDIENSFVDATPATSKPLLSP